MKLRRIIIVSLFCILAFGCEERVKLSSDRQLMNTELVNSYNDIEVRNAIISECTLYPYHFAKSTAELNELGQRNLDILAEHFMENPGHLNIRRGSTPADLYRARVRLVLDKLEEAGVNARQISVSDDMPGGSGMTSERILTILQDERKDTPTGQTIGSVGVR